MKLTDGFSAAEIIGVCNNAAIEALCERVEKLGMNRIITNKTKITISQVHFIQALGAAKISTSSSPYD